MISSVAFQRALLSLGRSPNKGQGQAVFAAKDDPLFVVAGPGTGKTATLTMRILKLIYVDGVAPSGILATTFTKKAAEELRSRLLSWGYAVQEYLQTMEKLTKIQQLWLLRIDVNQVRTGTIDSLCEELLRDFRDPGTDPPILADEFVSSTLLLRAGMFGGNRYKDDDLDQYLCSTRGTGRFGWHLGAKTGLVRTMWDRRHHDQLNWGGFSTAGKSKEENAALGHLDNAHTDYAAELKSRLMVDFAQLEQEVLDRLRKGGLREFTDTLEAVLVDEYQDSNLLQENLYFELAKRCEGALTVVGDDDQSMYRFRGATVDLFRDFEIRFAAAKFKSRPQKIFLNENYRSSKRIIEFVNSYATMDTDYQAVRVAGKPPLINPKPRDHEFPILGMFRPTMEDLAADLATFIHDVTRGSGRKINGHILKIDKSKNGDIGDCALLCSSPQEYGYAAPGKPPKERLPLVLKEALASKKPAIQVFNPRGQDFTSIPIVRRLGGLLLKCLDPDGDAEDKVKKGIGNDVSLEFQAWYSEIELWLKSSSCPKGLRDYVDCWSQRDPGRSGYKWPKNTSCIELIYGLVHWLPEFHDDPEGQVYLEVFTRQLAAAEQVSPFKSRVVTDPTKKDLSDTSVGHLLLYFLAPIASGTAKVDEELIESFPRDRLSVLSIHQSKGLEFPLVIVDVGSDFNTDHRMNAFKRFPNSPGMPHNLEDLMRPHSKLKKPSRDGKDRAFDDLYRQYFVAFSRPQDVLLLVGLSGSHPSGGIRNVATGWDRNEVNHWKAKLPFEEI
jgi:DNA helicase-2/ATP-dependent DNA helicase PcrA